MDTPTINIQYVSGKTEGEVYNQIINGVVQAVSVIAYEPGLLRMAELELREALALVNLYQSRIVMARRMEQENERINNEGVTL